MDPRRRRSRGRLYAAALDLASAEPIASLSVTQVADAAGVHRSTFYEHASSPAGLVEQALTGELDDLRAALLEDRSDAATAVATVTEGVLDHVARHAAIYRRELADGRGSLHAMLSRHFRETTRILLERDRVRIDVDVDGVPHSEVDEAASRFLADGTVGVIEGWLQHPEPRVEDFLRVYLAILPGWWPQVG
ncbi:TetR/AcrR family transcriptional regulator [Microbacterium sp. B2969]|uniref:TetR/AcrR family transcriptional regulator n=1 Tax=Microbacterium alkaliflavum TaxID=3248839 RepID=A0ABW7Q1Y0_9MICO